MINYGRGTTPYLLMAIAAINRITINWNEEYADEANAHTKKPYTLEKRSEKT